MRAELSRKTTTVVVYIVIPNGETVTFDTGVRARIKGVEFKNMATLEYKGDWSTKVVTQPLKKNGAISKHPERYIWRRWPENLYNTPEVQRALAAAVEVLEEMEAQDAR